MVKWDQKTYEQQRTRVWQNMINDFKVYVLQTYSKTILTDCKMFFCLSVKHILVLFSFMATNHVWFVCSGWKYMIIERIFYCQTTNLTLSKVNRESTLTGYCHKRMLVIFFTWNTKSWIVNVDIISLPPPLHDCHNKG